MLRDAAQQVLAVDVLAFGEAAPEAWRSALQSGKKMIRALLAAFGTALPLSTFGAVPVQIAQSGTDAVGQRLVFYYKEALRDSTSFTVSLESALGFRVRIVTLDPNGGTNSGYSTVYSATWTWNNPNEPFDYYLTQVVGTCGGNRVRECAEDLLVTTNAELEKIQALINAANKGK